MCDDPVRRARDERQQHRARHRYGAVQGSSAAAPVDARAHEGTSSLRIRRRARRVARRRRSPRRRVRRRAAAVPPRRRSTAPNDRRLPGVPRRQRVEHEDVVDAARAHATRRHYIANISATGARRSCTPTSAAAARTASRSWSCRDRSRSVADPLHRVRRRERSRTVPDPAERAGRRRLASDRRPARARACNRDTCHLYELGRAFWRGDHWDADVGVNWNLASNALRPMGWTSADAAGLPILPGSRALRRGRGGRIDHALRFTVPTHAARLHPPGDALRVVVDRPDAAADGTAAAAEGELRPLAAITGQSLVILKALKKYGMIVADNGSTWFITGAADPAGTTTT